jgi:glycosyltransferase involved in cell wall biosynthesis
LAKRADAVISNSKAVSDFIAKKENLKAEKARVIYNGLEEYTVVSKDSFTLFNQEDSIKLVLVANIKPVKRTLDAVVAITQLIEEGHNLELALVGENQDKGYVARIVDVINKTNTDKLIRLTGSIAEPRRLLSQAHIGLLVSESEGLSNTIMEYMHAGLPVIATDVGGNPELVIDNRTGLLIEKGNIEQLKSAILSLAANIELRESLGVEGKSLIQNEFSIAALISKHEEIYISKSAHAQ